MVYGYESFFTLFLSLLGMGIVFLAQTKITSSYGKYKKVSNGKKMSGQEVARKILDANGLESVHVVEVAGELTDHYDPARKVVRLSTDIFHGESIAAMSVAAHECGHAIQDKVGYFMMRLRSSIVPIVNLVSYAGYFITIIALLFGAMAYFKVGILTLLATLVFQLVTLPVEFDASERAKKELIRLHITENKEDSSVRDMLFAAALTYVAGLINTLLNVLRLVIMMRRRDD